MNQNFVKATLNPTNNENFCSLFKKKVVFCEVKPGYETTEEEKVKKRCKLQQGQLEFKRVSKFEILGIPCLTQDEYQELDFTDFIWDTRKKVNFQRCC